LPSPIWPVWSGRTIVSTTRCRLSSEQVTSILTLGTKIHGVLGAAIVLGVALLAAEPADFGDRHAVDAVLGQRVLHVFQLERRMIASTFFIALVLRG
jgi:hypothetical protein